MKTLLETKQPEENKIELHRGRLNYTKRMNAHLCCGLVVPPSIGLAAVLLQVIVARLRRQSRGLVIGGAVGCLLDLGGLGICCAVDLEEGMQCLLCLGGWR